MDINLKDFAIKRYNMIPYYVGEEGHIPPDWEEREDGYWVRFEDLQPLLARLEHLEKQLSLCNLKIIKAREVLS